MLYADFNITVGSRGTSSEQSARMLIKCDEAEDKQLHFVNVFTFVNPAVIARG